jgi:probable HAF family extracellular repeat protein
MHVPVRLFLILLGAVAAHASAADGKPPAVSPTAVATRSLGITAPAGVSTIAYDVNARGQVAAVLRDEAGRQRGVLFDKGGTTELTPADGKYSDARGINPDGEIIGSASQQDGTWRAFLFDRARGRRELPTLGGPSSYGMGINDAGHAVGFADTAAGEWHAFLYTGGAALTDLGTLGGKMSYASGMNNAGQVVGTAATHDDYRHAFVYDAANGMRDLGTLGGRLSSATAINDAGMIAGASETKDHQWHAFVHDGKSMVDLGAIIGYGSSYASDINNAGHVVGTVLVGDERSTFVWRDGKMSVHRGGRSLHLTNAINDAEQVIGATFFLRLNAATMPSDAPPAVPKDPSTPFGKIGMLMLLSGAAFAFRHFTRATTLRSA